MKKILFAVFIAMTFWACSSDSTSGATAARSETDYSILFKVAIAYAGAGEFQVEPYMMKFEFHVLNETDAQYCVQKSGEELKCATMLYSIEESDNGSGDWGYVLQNDDLLIGFAPKDSEMNNHPDLLILDMSTGVAVVYLTSDDDIELAKKSLVELYED